MPGHSCAARAQLCTGATCACVHRWLDARKVWGGILNRSRDIVRQVGCTTSRETCRTEQAL